MKNKEPEQRFRRELEEAVEKAISKFFTGKDLVFPVMRSDGEHRNNPIKTTVKISKLDLLNFIYLEILKQVPWLKEYKAKENPDAQVHYQVRIISNVNGEVIETMEGVNGRLIDILEGWLFQLRKHENEIKQKS